MYQWRVSVTSTEGQYSRTLCDTDPQVQDFKSLVGSDNFNTFKFLLISWTSLIGDSPLEQEKPNSVINKFFNQFLSDPIGVIKFYSDLAHDVERNLDLKSEEDGISASLFHDFKGTPIFREFLAFTKSHEPVLLRYILSFCHFGKKVAYINSDLDSVALRQWIEVEDRLEALNLPPWIDNLKRVMDTITSGWSCDKIDFLPKHGNGSVAERGLTGSELKNTAMELPKKISYLYRKEGLIGGTIAELGPEIHYPDRHDCCTQTSRLLFVPKSWKTTRSICMEPVAFQWAQQGVRTWYEGQLSDSVLRHHVVLQDQGVNQHAAKVGSINNQIDTIDLSSASDSVAWTLVKRVYKPGILKHLAATRTSQVLLPDGSIHSAHKFAPMGSALCFPVQSTLYSAIVAMTYIAHEYSLDWRKEGSFDHLDMSLAWRTAMQNGTFKEKGEFDLYPFRVYGDDITCDNRVTSNVIEALTSLGFTVNTDKSFVGGATFRESCGRSYHKGHDVTPIRFSIKTLTKSVSVETMTGVIALSNRALDYGYLNLRKHLIQYAMYTDIQGVRRKPDSINPILFVNEDDLDTSFGIRCIMPRNTHLKHRSASYDENSRETNARYQRSEYRSITSGPKSKRKLSHNHDNYHLWLWWRSRYHGSRDMRSNYIYLTKDGSTIVDPPGYEADDNPASSIMTDDVLRTGVKWRWTPT